MYFDELRWVNILSSLTVLPLTLKEGLLQHGQPRGVAGYRYSDPRRIEWALCEGILEGVYLQLAAERYSPAIHGQQLVLPRWWRAPVSSLGRPHATRTDSLLVFVVSRRASAAKLVLCGVSDDVTRCCPEQALQPLCSPVLLRREYCVCVAVWC